MVGCSHTDNVVDIISSAIQFAALDKIFAVAGATKIKSISNDKFICSNPAFGESGNKFVITSLFVNAANVAFPINFSAEAVIITCTLASCFVSNRINSQALNAAIDPVTHSSIFLSFREFTF